MDIQFVCPQEQEPTDTEILSFWRLVFSAEQLRWNPDDSPGLAHWEDRRVIEFCRGNLLKREGQFGIWAVGDGQVVGFAGIHVGDEASRSHCGELGFGVDARYQRHGIGLRLLAEIEQRAVAKGLHRIECSCFADNAAAVALLRKAGFTQEGQKQESIRQGACFIDQVLFGKIIAACEWHEGKADG